jgi:hypothetical protein
MLVGLSMACLHTQASVTLPVGDGQSVELYSNSYALVIGVSDYKHWPDLPGVETDVDEVGLALESHGFKVITLLNPTRNSFDDAMREFIAEHGQDPNNRLIVYYAGHGHTLRTRRGRELGYIVPTDAPLPKDGVGKFKARAISMLEVEIFAKQMEAKHAMFTFDSCFSGSLFEITRAIPDNISQKTAEPVRQFITAGSAEQTVPDKSVFRSQFIAGLDGEADINKDGFITGTELAQFIEESVTNYTRRAQTPQYGKIRDPILDKGDFIFVSPKVEVTIKQEAPRATDKAAIELAYWNTIKDTKSVEAYSAYLSEYPDGQFAKLAKVLVKQVQQEAKRSVALRKQRLEEEQSFAALQKARETEFKRQQELLEKQRLENEKQLASMRAQQEELAAAGSSEAARLQKLLEEKEAQLEKQQALAKSGAQVASIAPASQVAAKKIVVMSWADFGSAGVHPPLGPYTAKVNKLLKKQMDSLFPGASYQDFPYRHAKDVLYESNDYEASKRACASSQADYVYAVTVEGSHSGTGFVADSTYWFFDCAKQKKIFASYAIERGGTEEFRFAKDLKKDFARFRFEINSEIE